MKPVSNSTPERHILFLKEATSTNAEALRLAKENAPHGTIVIARRQSKGRGRYDRSWDSPEGNLHMSILLRPDMDMAPYLPQLSFVAAVACRDALDEAGLPGIQFKWPNDLLIKGRKFGGILLESVGKGEAVVVGIGINIAHFPADAAFPATSLAAENFPMPTEELMHLILPDFERRYAEWHAHDFEGIRQTWLAHAAHIHEKVSLRLPEGKVEGILEGMGEDGALLLKVDGKIKKFLAGDVLFGKG
jgi:BirA family biotin operon repressor/biotin-[acetyl-CoA-carboxylase] ligase